MQPITHINTRNNIEINAQKNENNSIKSTASTGLPEVNLDITPLRAPANSLDWGLIETMSQMPESNKHENENADIQHDWMLINYADQPVIPSNEPEKHLPPLTNVSPSLKTQNSLNSKIKTADSRLLSSWLPVLDAGTTQNILGGCFILSVAALSVYGALQGQLPGAKGHTPGLTLWNIN